MTTLATIGLWAGDGWQISVGGSWIAVMLIGMALCFVAMFAFMGLMRGGHGWALCGPRWQQQTTRKDMVTGTSVQTPDDTASSPESEVSP